MPPLFERDPVMTKPRKFEYDYSDIRKLIDDEGHKSTLYQHVTRGHLQPENLRYTRLALFSQSLAAPLAATLQIGYDTEL